MKKGLKFLNLLKNFSKRKKGVNNTYRKGKGNFKQYEMYEKGINQEISDKFWESLGIISALPDGTKNKICRNVLFDCINSEYCFNQRMC